MRKKKKTAKRIAIETLFIGGTTIGLYSFVPPEIIDNYYSNGLYSNIITPIIGKIGDTIPFSLIETFLLATGGGIFYAFSLGFYHGVKNFKSWFSDKKEKKNRKKFEFRGIIEKSKIFGNWGLNRLHCLSYVALTYTLLMGLNFNRLSVIEKLKIPDSKNNEVFCLDDLIERINMSYSKIEEYPKEMNSLIPEMNKSLDEAYKFVHNGKDFVSSAPKIKKSFVLPLRELTIGGLTVPPLESIVDFEKIDFFTIWVMMHELVHLRKGYLREPDAEALAYLACLNSKEPILEYSALMHFLYLNLGEEYVIKKNSVLDKNPAGELKGFIKETVESSEKKSTKAFIKVSDFAMKLRGEESIEKIYTTDSLKAIKIIDEYFRKGDLNYSGKKR